MATPSVDAGAVVATPSVEPELVDATLSVDAGAVDATPSVDAGASVDAGGAITGQVTTTSALARYQFCSSADIPQNWRDTTPSAGTSTTSSADTEAPGAITGGGSNTAGENSDIVNDSVVLFVTVHVTVA